MTSWSSGGGEAECIYQGSPEVDHEEKKGSVRDLGDDGGPNKTSPPGPLHRFHLN